MIEHLSYSSISAYLYCGANWRFKYVDKVETPASPELAFGSAFHAAIEKHLISERRDDLLACWSEAWKLQLEKETVEWNGANPEVYYNDGVRMFSQAEVQQGILSIQPGMDDVGMMLERRVSLNVPGVPVPVIGFIDVITQDGIPGDFKTSKASWSAEKAEAEMQPLFYLAALNQAGVNVKDWRFRHYIFVKTKTPQFQTLEHRHNPAQLLWLFQMIRNVWRGIEAGIYPENPTGWKCSPKWCEFWQLCRGKGG